MSISQERYIERNAVELIAQHFPKVDCKKVTWPGYPDRIIMLGKGKHIWIEFKTAGGLLTPLQKAIHAQLRARGDHVHICRSARDALGVVAGAFRAVPAPKGDRAPAQAEAPDTPVCPAWWREDSRNANSD
jgi:hypothetical protein